MHSSDIDWCNYWLSSESDTQRPIDSSLWYCGASISTVLSLICFVIILHKEVLKQYHFSQMKPFILKMFTALVIMTIIIQIIMQILPQVGRIGGLIELVVVAIIGIAVLLILVIYMNILGYKELKHLPFGEKLYHIKKGRH